MIKKIVLAYSGGLDTSVAIRWLKEAYNTEIVAFCADLGQGEDLSEVREKAVKTGASKVFVEDLREEFVSGYLFPMLRANTVYEGAYLLGTSIARPLIAKKQIEIGNITLRKTTGPATIIAITSPATSAGVDTGSISAWNRIPYVVASGASTKQIGLKGTNSAGATIYDSQALTGTTSVLMNSAFVTITEYYIGDLESTRTATITAQGGIAVNDDLLLPSAGDIRWSTDTGLARSAAGVVKVTDGSAGYGSLMVGDGAQGAPSIRFPNDSDTGFYWVGVDGLFAATCNGTPVMLFRDTGISSNNQIYMKRYIRYVVPSTPGSGAPNAIAPRARDQISQKRLLLRPAGSLCQPGSSAAIPPSHEIPQARRWMLGTALG